MGKTDNEGLIKNSHLNSESAYDAESSEHLCMAPQPKAMVKPKETDINDEYSPYQHTESDETISTWNV